MTDAQSSHSTPLEVADIDDDLVIRLSFADIRNHSSGIDAVVTSLNLFRAQHLRARYRNGDARFFLEEFDEIPSKEHLEANDGQIRIPSLVDECLRPEAYGVVTFSGWQPRQKRAHCFQVLNGYVQNQRHDKLPERWMDAVRTLYPGET